MTLMEVMCDRDGALLEVIDGDGTSGGLESQAAGEGSHEAAEQHGVLWELELVSTGSG